MSGTKKWVSSKVHRKTSSRSNISSNLSGLSLDGLVPFPPNRLPDEDATVATSVVDFMSGSTLMTQRFDGATGGPSVEWSNSSIDSESTGLTQSPSSTPPKKIWEQNYKSFLKRTGKHSKSAAPSDASHAPIQHRAAPLKPSIRTHPSNQQKRSGSMSYNLLSNASHQQSLPATQKHDNDISVAYSRPGLADGFEEQLSNDSKYSYLSTPPSPPKHKEAGTRGGAFFKRMGSTGGTSSKSVENLNLDATMRKGVDRKSPNDTPLNTPLNTPPGSAVTTPMKKSSMLQEAVEKVEKASTSTEVLFPLLASPNSLGHNQDHRPVLSHRGTDNSYSLDTARHRGFNVSTAQSAVIPQKGMPPQLVSRAQSVVSMSSTINIPEEEPSVVNHDEEDIRDCRKAFTDFHNMGVDSSSAYLGDELSLHKNSFFLSSMAYPAGSAGGKALSRYTFSGGSRSLDQKRSSVTPSTSLNSISETKQRTDSDAEILPEPERSLRSLKGPEHWSKGERHAIIPGVLCMCPIQVLNNIMSKEEGYSQRPSLTSSRGSQRGFGIGSILQDESGDSNGWFFADHHQPTAAVGQLPLHSGGSIGIRNSVSSAFGKILLGKATVSPVGMRSFLNESYGWCTGVFILRQNYLFEYREGDSQNGLPWGYAHLPFAEAYPHKHFMNALHLDFFERPCHKSGKRSLLLRVESKNERDRWVSLLQAASRMTMHDLYDVDESDGALIFGEGRYAKVLPAKRKDRRRSMSFSGARLQAAKSQENIWRDGLGGGNKSSTDLVGAMVEYNCALKIVDKKEFWTRVKKGRERADTLVREVAVQATLAVLGAETSGFLRLLNIFETGEHLVLELELLKGTDLFQHVSSRGVLDEAEAAHITRDLLNCLNVLDQIGIAHRDIKPANILMCHDENNNGSKIKLADYGMASFVGVDNLVRGRCGTPGFVAPEILLTRVNGGYGNKVDMFSAGVTLYVMLAGYEPFYGESDIELINANREAKVVFPHADWHTVSVEGRDLIERMLIVDPSKRIGPSEALRHPWITRRAPSNEDVGNQASCSTS